MISHLLCLAKIWNSEQINLNSAPRTFTKKYLCLRNHIQQDVNQWIQCQFGDKTSKFNYSLGANYVQSVYASDLTPQITNMPSLILHTHFLKIGIATLIEFVVVVVMVVRVLVGLDLFNDDTRPSGHISRPTQVNVSQELLSFSKKPSYTGKCVSELLSFSKLLLKSDHIVHVWGLVDVNKLHHIR